jgi:hypothetical protein
MSTQEVTAKVAQALAYATAQAVSCWLPDVAAQYFSFYCHLFH